MARETFIPTKFQARTLDVIEQANAIIAEYAAKGFTMTLRQLYYQFVSRDLTPNEPKSYKRLIKTVSDAPQRRADRLGRHRGSAKRGGPGTPQAKTWVSLEPGWKVFDDDGMLVGDMTASLCIEGFRAWVTDDRARLEKCNCDFGGCENAEVNPHYRIKRALLARPRAP